MALPLHTPYSPMEALSVDTIPVGPEWQYEPKWDGFRCLVFRDGKSVELQAKSGRSLARYFPEYRNQSIRIRLSPATTRLSEANRWLKRVGATLDGVVAKRADLEYRSGDRTGMAKIKNYRSADCVVGGFRYNEGKPYVGSLLLGLYDGQGLLHHVGFTSTIRREDKPRLTEALERLAAPPGFTGNAPGGPSRWSTKRSSEWQPLNPTLVVEVCYGHFTGERFRHGTRLLRWRPDKAPQQCSLDQVRQTKANLLSLLT